MGRQVLVLDYGEAGSQHPDIPDMTRITQFECYIGGMRLDPSSGELLLQVRVPATYKQEAFELSDLTNFRLVFDVYKGLTRKQKRALMQQMGVTDEEFANARIDGDSSDSDDEDDDGDDDEDGG